MANLNITCWGFVELENRDSNHPNCVQMPVALHSPEEAYTFQKINEKRGKVRLFTEIYLTVKFEDKPSDLAYCSYCDRETDHREGKCRKCGN